MLGCRPFVSKTNRQSVGKAIGQNGELQIVTENPSSEDHSTKGLGSALEQLDLLSGGSKDKKESFLSEVRVEFEVEVPGLSHPKKIIRPIYKETNPTPRSLNKSEKLIRSAAISSRADLLITGGFFDRSYARMFSGRVRYLGMQSSLSIISQAKRMTTGSVKDNLSPLISRVKETRSYFTTKLYGIACTS